MKRNRIVLLIIMLFIILGSCASSNLQTDDTNTESFIEKYTDHMILENGCVIVVAKGDRGGLHVAAACPIIITDN